MSIIVHFTMPDNEECWAKLPQVPQPGDKVTVRLLAGTDDYFDHEYTVGNDPISWVIEGTEVVIADHNKKPKPPPDVQTAQLKVRLL